MIVAMSNSKGGVGKSTLAVHLAVYLKERGADVMLVDADAQGSSSVWLQETMPNVAVARLQTPDEILDRLPELARRSDFLVVDGPGGLSEVTRAILLMTDLAVLPCGPSVLDLRAAHDAIRVVRQAQAIRRGPPRVVLVPNKLQVQYRLSQEFMEATRSLEIPTVPGLRLRQAFAEAAGQGTVVWRLGERGRSAANEIKELFNGIFGQESKDDERSAANG